MKSSLSNTVETTPFSWMKMTSQCVLSSCTAIWAQFLDVAVMLGGLAYIPIREATNCAFSPTPSKWRVSTDRNDWSVSSQSVPPTLKYIPPVA